MNPEPARSNSPKARRLPGTWRSTPSREKCDAIAFMLKLILTGAAFAAVLAAQQPCESLSRLTLPHTTVTSATLVAATDAIPAHCDVKATARPTSDSEIKFQLWLPPSAWNGKYEQVGNGGWAGSIPVASFSDPL